MNPNSAPIPTPYGLPFDLHALEVFLAVCESGNMASAARQLGVTQPAVSQMIADIEARTGTVLFDRRIRPLGVTAAGSVLRQCASALLADARQITPLLREVIAGRLPLVRVGTVESLSRALTQAMAAFLADRTEQSVFLSGLTASHAAALLTRQLDLVLGVDDLEDVEGLERFPLLEEPYFLLCPDSENPPDSVPDLATMLQRLPMVRFSARSRTGADVERHLRRLRLDIPFRQEFDSPYGVINAARGKAIALMTPFCLYEAGLDLTGLRCHALPGPRFTRRLTLVARKRELGRLPAELAQSMHKTLRTDCLPRIIEALPAFADQIVIAP